MYQIKSNKKDPFLHIFWKNHWSYTDSDTISSFYYKILTNWYNLVGFVTLALFDNSLCISQKENTKNSFFSWEISYRTAVSFFMVRSVLMVLIVSLYSFWRVPSCHIVFYRDNKVCQCIMELAILFVSWSLAISNPSLATLK